MAAIVELGFTLIGLIFFSVLAFWKRATLLCMVSSGVAIMLGYAWFDGIATDTGLAVSLLLIGYSFVMIGFGFKYLFWTEEDE